MPLRSRLLRLFAGLVVLALTLAGGFALFAWSKCPTGAPTRWPRGRRCCPATSCCPRR